MTPMWKEAIREVINLSYKDRLLKNFFVSKYALAAARCFDLREIQRLCWYTSEELSDAAEGRAQSFGGREATGWSVDIGERSCLPSDVVWLEFRDLAILIANGDFTPEAPITPFAPGAYMVAIIQQFRYADGSKAQKVMAGGQLLLDGGIADYTVGEAKPDMSPIEQKQAFLMGLAAIAAINSPASNRETVEPHRGFLKSTRGLREIVPPGITHTRVTIRVGTTPQKGEVSGVSSSNPKAYHFCRAHTRQRANGRVEWVRAHWRGDPAFGYRLPSYTVRPADQEAEEAA